ncbi:MAG: hypothetical protein LBH69_01505 [Methanomassiliicoccaceae archaeon]|nr:hypothetical protein [Methanomassiliicoccaceae archaeon]
MAVITLVFGLLGIEFYQGLDWGMGIVAAPLAAIIGVVFVILTISALRFGNAFAASLFGFIAISLLIVPIAFGFSFMAFVIMAIFYLVFMIIAFLIGAPKLLGILLLLVALLYLFVGLFINDGLGDSVFGILFGIFGVLSFLVALYMAFALSTQKLPVF